jgi:hypothetical protein
VSLASGTKLGTYEILAPLGAGGMDFSEELQRLAPAGGK